MPSGLGCLGAGVRSVVLVASCPAVLASLLGSMCCVAFSLSELVYFNGFVDIGLHFVT